jgi:uncharacterized membrane protein YphA (DoxX/SURF4 family)
LTNRLLYRFNQWVFESYALPAEHLGLYRIFYASFMLFLVGIPGYAWISAFPDAFFHPPLGVARLFSGFPPPYVLHLFSVTLVVLFLALLFGYRTRAASVLITLVALVANSFDYSFGKINHTVLIWILPLVMSFSNWGAAYSVDANRDDPPSPVRVEAWPITLMSVLLGFAMFSAGLPKLMSGWLDLGTRAVKEKLLYQVYVNNRHEFLADFFVSLESAPFWELMDWATVVFELGFLAAVISPSVFRLFTGAAVIFHTTSLLMLNIGFMFHVIVYLLFSMPIIAFGHDRIQRVVGRLTAPSILAACLFYVTVHLLNLPATFPSMLSVVLGRVFHIHGNYPMLIVLLAASLVTLYLASQSLKDLFRRRAGVLSYRAHL